MSTVRPFSDEQARLLVNLRHRYESWIASERVLASLPYDLRRKDVGGRSYLYRISDRSGNGTSLGPWSDTNAAMFESYREDKRGAKHRLAAAAQALDESARLYRALRLPLLSSEAGQILREADKRMLLGAQLLVVGTNAMSAYAVEAAGFIPDMPDETEDFDLAWQSVEAVDDQSVWQMLKAVDPTFTINTERTFQARNARAYEVEILVAPSRAMTIARTDRPRPVPLPEQEWLLLGRPVDQVVVCRDGSPARIVAPDPRWFALQKLWMSEQPKRNPLKRPKDRKQGLLLLDSIDEAMPQFALDAPFEEALPLELAPLFQRWKEQRPARRPISW